LAALTYAGVGPGDVVLCPSNTFMATPHAAMHLGAEVKFIDCSRDDLCATLAEFERGIAQYRPKAAFLVHIGGHIAFEVEQIAALCRAEGVFLIEDCAHTHGASWNGKHPGTWGDAGVYSFYATKTVSTGEGGMLVSTNQDLIDYSKSFRNYGKPSYKIPGLNFRMSEFTAAIGVLQTARLDEIVAWKNRVATEFLDPVHRNRVEFPEGMTSGLYKYIVFDEIERSTGLVYDEPCHRILGHDVNLPNSDWVSTNHWCVPLYYRPEELSAETSRESVAIAS
jgi:dTDP-4-amino-4,6-dideoxygalactose transaminase